MKILKSFFLLSTVLFSRVIVSIFSLSLTVILYRLLFLPWRHLMLKKGLIPFVVYRGSLLRECYIDVYAVLLGYCFGFVIIGAVLLCWYAIIKRIF